MIDANKVNQAASIISRLPADRPLVIPDREDSWCKVKIEYPNHSLDIDIEHGSADVEPYIELLSSKELLQYFVEQALYWDHKYSELQEAFRITFFNLVEDNRKLQEHIAELEKES